MQIQNQVYGSTYANKNQIVKSPAQSSQSVSFSGAPMVPAKNRVVALFGKMFSRTNHPFSLNIEFANLSGCLESLKNNGVSHKLVQAGKKWQYVESYYPSGNKQYSYLFKRNKLSFISHYSDAKSAKHGENLLEEYSIREKNQVIDYVTLRENGKAKTVLSVNRGSTMLTKFDVHETDYRKKCQGSIHIDHKGCKELDGDGNVVSKLANVPQEYAQMPSLLKIKEEPKMASVYC